MVGTARIRTCDRLRVKELRYRCAKRPSAHTMEQNCLIAKRKLPGCYTKTRQRLYSSSIKTVAGAPHSHPHRQKQKLRMSMSSPVVLWLVSIDYLSRFNKNSASASSATALPLKILSAANALSVSCSATFRDFSRPTIDG